MDSNPANTMEGNLSLQSVAGNGNTNVVISPRLMEIGISPNILGIGRSRYRTSLADTNFELAMFSVSGENIFVVEIHRSSNRSTGDNTMSSTINSVASINPTQLKDDVEAMLTAAGFTLNDLRRLEDQLAYRKEYSQRPEVVRARKEYNRKRALKMKALRELLKGGE